MPPEPLTYVTSSPFKREEATLIQTQAVFPDGIPVAALFAFDYRDVPINEILEVDIAVMVQDEVVKAYNKIRVPCIVEHAGLVFEDYLGDGYPGGLTKPMWNTLKDKFLEETQSKGRPAIARAVIAYCDGTSVRTFVGETPGHMADVPRGSRSFYWDTVFIPKCAPGDPAAGLTYAEIADHAALGLRHKVLTLSQSYKAMMAFLSFRRTQGVPQLWR